VAMVSGAETVLLLLPIFAVTGGQVASVIAAGSVQLTLIGPKKLSVPTSVTDAVPDCPGAVMVTFDIGEAMLNVVSRTWTSSEYGLCDAE